MNTMLISKLKLALYIILICKAFELYLLFIEIKNTEYRSVLMFLISKFGNTEKC